MMKTKHYSLVLVLVLSCVALSHTPLFAQEAVSVKIQPSNINENADPGGVIEGVLTVTNQNGGTQTLYLNTRDIDGMKETGAPIFSTSRANDSQYASTWIEPLTDSVTLGVGESARVPYRISVPTDASPGSHYAAIFVSREPETQMETGAGVGFHVASLVHLRVSGEVVDDLLFRELSTDKSFYTHPSVSFVLKLENTGTVQQRPQGFITITDMLKNEVGNIDVNASAGAIMHGKVRAFTNDWSHEGFAFGKYTASAAISYGEKGSQKTLSRDVTFWVVPIKELGMVLGALVLIVLVFVFALRAYIRKELARAGHSTRKAPSQKVTFARMLVRNLLWIIGLLGVLFVGMLVFFG